MRHLGLRRKLLVLLLSAWLPLLVTVLLMSIAPTSLADIAALDPLRSLVIARLDADGGPRWAAPALLAASFLASLYLAVCARRALSEGLDRLRRGAQDMADGRPLVRAHGFGIDELGQTLDALVIAGDRMTHLQGLTGEHAGTVARCARELADAHLAMQLEALEVRSVVGEIARRTVALCGMRDSDMQDAERVSADLDAIHDDELQSLQLMAALRTRLLSLAQHCRALAEAARDGTAPRADEAGGSVDELAAAAGVELKHCHQLSERVGGAERLNEQRIDSMRLSADRLVHRAERGMGEAPQLMALTRQIEASLATTLQRLEQMTASCASLRGLVQGADAVRPAARAPSEPVAA